MSEVAERVKSLVADKLSRDKSELTNEASFANDLGADSLDTVELIMDFERAFNMKPIPDDQAQTIQTVGDAITYIEAHANEGQE